MKDFNKRLCNWDELFSSEEFEEEFCYKGDDLGCTYDVNESLFRVWAPTAAGVKLNIYDEGDGDNLINSFDMKSSTKGTWVYKLPGDWKNKYYTYSVTFDNVKVTEDKSNPFKVNLTYVEKGDTVTREVVDIYAKATGVNGKRGMIVDFNETNPEGWEDDTRPRFDKATDAIIYELHMRDLSMEENSGIKNKGTYLGVAEENTTTPSGTLTGLSHMKDLGVTHVHFLPLQDFGSIDETGNSTLKFNWGYDPVNYNVPEGSYSTNPYEGTVRIKEFKTMVKALHDNGIRVILDVVYNHTYDTRHSNFDNLVPNYYHRNQDGEFTNGSGCGNEMGSDRIMYRRFMINSVKHWINEYHIDGLRFDLMAVHDIKTMNALKKEVMAIDSSILIYGEGWIGGTTKFDSMEACFKVNAKELNDIAMFNDDIRDAVKGSISEPVVSGFATGAMYKNNIMYDSREVLTQKIRFGVAGSVKHKQVKGIQHTKRPEEYDGKEIVFWAKNPSQTINYVSAHDNWTLWDKICMSNEDESFETKVKMNKLCAAIVMLSQGIPFIHAGEEMLRSKKSLTGEPMYIGDSYNSPDEVNSLKWLDKEKYNDVYEYYKGLIAFRKRQDLLRLLNASEVRECLKFKGAVPEGIVAFTLSGTYSNGSPSEIFVVFNGLNKDYTIRLPEGDWRTYIDGNSAGTTVLSKDSGKTTVNALTARVFVKAYKKNQRK
ncbi:MAG: type I pullulanase [Lachnospiraceae bacterium]|nr:type I pullulanase [Lachnospiraceae bacterium]